MNSPVERAFSPFQNARIAAASIRSVSSTRILVVQIADGRVLILPLWLYPLLHAAAPSAQRNLQIIGRGRGLHWPTLDLDLSLAGMLAGTPDLTKLAKSTAKRLHLADYARIAAQPRRKAS